MGVLVNISDMLPSGDCYDKGHFTTLLSSYDGSTSIVGMLLCIVGSSLPVSVLRSWVAILDEYL